MTYEVNLRLYTYYGTPRMRACWSELSIREWLPTITQEVQFDLLTGKAHLALVISRWS